MDGKTETPDFRIAISRHLVTALCALGDTEPGGEIVVAVDLDHREFTGGLALEGGPLRFSP